MSDNLFNSAQQFRMTETSKQRILASLESKLARDTTKEPRFRRWITGVGAGAAAVLIVGAGLFGILLNHRPVSPTNKTTTVSSPRKNVKPSKITTRQDGTILYTYSGNNFLPGVKRYASFAVKIPQMSLTSETFERFPAKQNAGYPYKLELTPVVTLNGYLGNESLYILEMPEIKGKTTPFEDFVGTGKEPSSEGQPMVVQKYGVAVDVGWPSSTTGHCYQFVKSGTVYFVKATWNHPWAPKVSNDKVTWRLVKYLVDGKKV